MNYLFQNEHFVVLDKPPMVLTVPDRHQSDRPCLGLELQNELKTQIFPVHRLDFEVSGLVLFALHEKAHKASQEWFQKKLIQKKYIAWTFKQDFNHWPENIQTHRDSILPENKNQFLWKTQILRGKKRSYESKQGEWAETKARIVDFKNDVIQWELFPLTGKPHQLRLELSRRGFPILGDVLYGSESAVNEWGWSQKQGIALRAIELNMNEIPLLMKKQWQLPEMIKAD